MNEVTVIIETIKTLSVILVTIIPVSLAAIQYGKEKLKLTGRVAEVVSLVVGFVSSGLVALVYANSFDYQMVLGQWVGLGLFVVVGTISPSGGYKLLGVFTGTRKLE